LVQTRLIPGSHRGGLGHAELLGFTRETRSTGPEAVGYVDRNITCGYYIRISTLLDDAVRQIPYKASSSVSVVDRTLHHSRRAVVRSTALYLAAGATLKATTVTDIIETGIQIGKRTWNQFGTSFQLQCLLTLPSICTGLRGDITMKTWSTTPTTTLHLLIAHWNGITT